MYKIRLQSVSKFVLLIIASLVAMFIFVAYRVFVPGTENKWVCEEGRWVVHGTPSTSMPTTPCE